ncbi:MAG TPA: hypothetical protein VK659_06290 [Asanoa sp.]|nr:hypothetical protein [Asanoa sp.]
MSAVRPILVNPRYTGRQVWNRQRGDDVLCNVGETARGAGGQEEEEEDGAGDGDCPAYADCCMSGESAFPLCHAWHRLGGYGCWAPLSSPAGREGVSR